MVIVFRSDTRDMQEILKQGGFIPKDAELYAAYEQDERRKKEEETGAEPGPPVDPKTLVDERWSLYSAVRPPNEYDPKVTDALQNSTICMTKNPASAAIFPLESEEDTYIYAISIPDPIPIPLEAIESPEYENEALKATMFEPTDHPEYGSKGSFARAYDLHDLQAQQLDNFRRQRLVSEDTQSLKHASWAMGAFEVVTGRVRAEQVIGCIECKNRKLVKSGEPHETEFTLGNIETNHSATPVYEGDKKEGLKSLKAFKESQRGDEKLRSPTALHGLAGRVEAEAGGGSPSGKFYLKHIARTHQGLAPSLTASSLPDSAQSLSEVERKQLIYILTEIRYGSLALDEANRDKNSSVDISEQLDRSRLAITGEGLIAGQAVSEKVLKVLEDCKIQDVVLQQAINTIEQYHLDRENPEPDHPPSDSLNKKF